jgi:hypothetical protein
MGFNSAFKGLTGNKQGVFYGFLYTLFYEFRDAPLSETAVIRPMLSGVKYSVLWDDIVSGRFCGVKSFHGHRLNVAAAYCCNSVRHKYHTDCI